MQSRARRSYEKVQATSLSTRTLEGFECQGLLITASVRDETRQGDQLIQETLEEWVALKLSTPLLTQMTGGSSGIKAEHVVRLSHIIEGEPDSALFRIPSGFRLIDPKDAPKYGFAVPRQ